MKSLPYGCDYEETSDTGKRAILRGVGHSCVILGESVKIPGSLVVRFPEHPVAGAGQLTVGPSHGIYSRDKLAIETE